MPLIRGAAVLGVVGGGVVGGVVGGGVVFSIVDGVVVVVVVGEVIAVVDELGEQELIDIRRNPTSNVNAAKTSTLFT